MMYPNFKFSLTFLASLSLLLAMPARGTEGEAFAKASKRHNVKRHNVKRKRHSRHKRHSKHKAKGYVVRPADLAKTPLQKPSGKLWIF